MGGNSCLKIQLLRKYTAKLKRYKIIPCMHLSIHLSASANLKIQRRKLDWIII